jgi:6-phosphogluconolactonase (cycloisomerase 2 family)
MARKNVFLELILLVGFSLVSASLWAHAGGGFAYVVNFGSNDVWAFTIDGTTGALRPAGSPVAAGANPRSVTTTAGGR